jgi:hypothetical protein
MTTDDITAETALALSRQTQAAKAFIAELEKLAVEQALKAQQRMFVPFDDALCISSEKGNIQRLAGRGSSFTLQCEELLQVLSQRGRMLDKHFRAITEFRKRGYRIEAEASKSRLADPLAFAPELSGWRLIWERHDAAEGSSSFAPHLRSAKALNELARGAALVEQGLSQVLKTVRSAAENGDTQTFVTLGRMQTELLTAIRDAVQARGFAVVMPERESSPEHVPGIRVAWDA